MKQRARVNTTRFRGTSRAARFAVIRRSTLRLSARHAPRQRAAMEKAQFGSLGITFPVDGPCPIPSGARHYWPMHRGSWFGVVLLVAALAFQIWVTLRLRRTTIYDRSQKNAQAKLIWLLPVVGAAIVFSVLVSEEAYERKDSGGQSS